MKPWETLDTAQVPDVGEVTLTRRGSEYVLRVRGQTLMSSRQHGSEEALAQAGCADLAGKSGGHVLVGGLGFGYTLRAVLNHVGPGTRVTVAELLPAVVAWNRGPLAPLAGAPLEDPRVTVAEGDVGALMARQSNTYDAILLDVDNGPTALTHPDNHGLYGPAGLARAFHALRARGTLGIWSAGPAPGFERRMEKAGFTVQVLHPAAHGTKGTRHTLFMGRRGR
jgi:spermidine synthase